VFVLEDERATELSLIVLLLSINANHAGAWIENRNSVRPRTTASRYAYPLYCCPLSATSPTLNPSRMTEARRPV
jgi:hypothetical protein